jgi:hypothetical protein
MNLALSLNEFLSFSSDLNPASKDSFYAYMEYDNENSDEYHYFGPPPNVTVIENITYCWDESLQSYTWCQSDTDLLYSVPLSKYHFINLTDLKCRLGPSGCLFAAAFSALSSYSLGTVFQKP